MSPNQSASHATAHLEDVLPVFEAAAVNQIGSAERVHGDLTFTLFRPVTPDAMSLKEGLDPCLEPRNRGGWLRNGVKHPGRRSTRHLRVERQCTESDQQQVSVTIKH